MVYIVATYVKMKPIALIKIPKNMSIRREATQKKEMRMTNESHDFIIDKISRR